jgi:acyl-CoA synthetase (AMP-forming)/AMP-acid ligase II
MSLQAQENLSFVSGPRDQPLWSKTLGSVIAEQSQKYSDRIAVSFPQQRVRMTYQQLEISSRIVANALIKLALQPGDCVGILSGNCYQYIEVFLGSGRIGCPVVVFNNTYSPQELLRAVNLPSKCLIISL